MQGSQLPRLLHQVISYISHNASVFWDSADNQWWLFLQVFLMWVLACLKEHSAIFKLGSNSLTCVLSKIWANIANTSAVRTVTIESQFDPLQAFQFNSYQIQSDLIIMGFPLQ